jgi:succinyl-diaminopimelate desuccinylase
VDALEITKELIKIDTRNPPGHTTRAVEFLESIFSSFETKVLAKEDGKENLVVEINKGEPVVMLTSHLDTVPCDDMLLNPVIVDGKLYGRGASDAKGCVAAICQAAFELAKEDIAAGLKLAFTADEEIGGINGLAYVFPKVRADCVLIGEPTGVDKVGVLQAAVLSIDIEIEGESGHTATQDARKGAIYRASEYIIETFEKFGHLKGEFEEYNKFFKSIGYDFVIKGGHAVFNPAMIKGGIKRNVVAPKCTVHADVRFAPWIDVEDVRNAIYDDRVESFKVNGVLQPYGTRFDDVDVEKDLRILEILKKIIMRRGYSPKAAFSLGVGDSRHVRKYGVPAFYLGPSGNNSIHSDNEFVYISELQEVAEMYTEFVRLYSDINQ